ncbi:MAG TPA: DUF885 family protein, partial [Fimbriimonadaceae bacterium]|nr:DUF885 family protein [Fimbriimonadaceae bacterium]
MVPLLLCLTLAGISHHVEATRQLGESELRPVLEQFSADEGSLSRTYPLELSGNRRQRLEAFYRDRLKELERTAYDGLSFDAQIDYQILRNSLGRRLSDLTTRGKEQERIAALVPFARTILELEEARRRMEPVEAQKAAAALDSMTKSLKTLRGQLGGDVKASRYEANAAVAAVRGLRETLRTWHGFYDGYDPLFSWWMTEPYRAADAELNSYVGALREKLIGVKPDDENAIVGNPIGRDALIEALQYEMIPYSPDELIAIGEREYAWCEAEIKKASRELGFGDDWRKAMEHVKGLHVEPGKQPEMIRELAVEAIRFLEERDLVTVPELAKETWRMDMMSPERQLVSPFFLGGETIIVSYPTDTMTHEQKLMSMRGNNRYFSRATVQHELIPGHHLQGFMNARYKPYRRAYGTPFWTEGWALYWEMLLWDLGFPKTPEERIGMLFWRMHRCVRITFSLGFHLGKLTPEECIEMLVQRVGHERSTAEGEVRRSLGGTYPPLYQAAYMVGGLQFRALHKELVGGGKLTNRQFHDAILQENN